MRVITNGHECEDAVRQIIQLFFNINDDITAFSAFESCSGGFCTKAPVVYRTEEKARDEYSVNTAASKRVVKRRGEKNRFFRLAGSFRIFLHRGGFQRESARQKQRAK